MRNIRLSYGHYSTNWAKIVINTALFASHQALAQLQSSVYHAIVFSLSQLNVKLDTAAAIAGIAGKDAGGPGESAAASWHSCTETSSAGRRSVEQDQPPRQPHNAFCELPFAAQLSR